MNITVETPACPMCGRSTQLTVDQNKYERWRCGELIQRVWPEWMADQRELLITGTHSECWERMFPEEKEALVLATIEPRQLDNPVHSDMRPAFKIVVTIPIDHSSDLDGLAYCTDQEIITTLEADLLDILASEGVTMEVVRI